MIIDFEQLKENAVEFATALMAASAKTAPKSKGKDDLEIKFFNGDELKTAIEFMQTDEYIQRTTGKKEFFIDSDAEVLKNCDGVLAIGVKSKRAMNMNCGKCGCKNCLEFNKRVLKKEDVNCIFKILDLGFATSSACKIASDLNIDNRVMYDIGESIRIKFLKECDVVLGIAISIKGNNIFFDRYLRFFVEKARKNKCKVDDILKIYSIKT